jgi:hypothetical protein
VALTLNSRLELNILFKDHIINELIYILNLFQLVSLMWDSVIISLRRSKLKTNKTSGSNGSQLLSKCKLM